jgi:hypothetical protein
MLVEKKRDGRLVGFMNYPLGSSQYLPQKQGKLLEIFAF